MSLSQSYTDVLYATNKNLNLNLPFELHSHEAWFLEIHSLWLESTTFFPQEYILEINCNLVETFTKNNFDKTTTIARPLQVVYFSYNQKPHLNIFTQNNKYLINCSSNHINFYIKSINYPLQDDFNVGIHFSIKRFN